MNLYKHPATKRIMIPLTIFFAIDCILSLGSFLFKNFVAPGIFAIIASPFGILSVIFMIWLAVIVWGLQKKQEKKTPQPGLQQK